MPDFHEKFRIEDIHVVRSTANAILIEADGDQIWVPRSQIDDDSEVWWPGQDGTLIVSDWWARQKGLV